MIIYASCLERIPPLPKIGSLWVSLHNFSGGLGSAKYTEVDYCSLDFLYTYYFHILQLICQFIFHIYYIWRVRELVYKHDGAKMVSQDRKIQVDIVNSIEINYFKLILSLFFSLFPISYLKLFLSLFFFLYIAECCCGQNHIHLLPPTIP